MITPSFGLTATERVLPKLALDFTTAALDSRVTFTRTTGASNPATFVNSSGYVTAATNNQPRFDFDPVTLACKGLLIEESRTNLEKNSDNFAAWTLTRCTVSSDATTGPDGATSGDKLVETLVAASTHYAYQFVSTTNGQPHTFSMYVKAAERSWICIIFGANNSAFNGAATYFDVANGTLGTVGTGTTATITAAGNGWYRITATQTATATTSGAVVQVNLASANNTNSYAGDGTSGLYVWGAQLEVGAFATSYIPTTTAALTRNADVATMTGTNFSSWFNASEGTFVFNGSTINFTNSDVIVDASDGTTSNRIQMFVAGVTGAATTFMATGGATQAQFSAGAVTANTTFTFASGYKVNAIAASLNAATPATDTSATMPSGINAVTLGCRFNGVNQLNGYLRKINYYPQRLTNAEIQAFSK